jgi:hypothetical protein
MAIFDSDIHYKFYINSKLEFMHLPHTYIKTNPQDVLEEFLLGKSFLNYKRYYNLKSVKLALVKNSLVFEITVQ